MAKKFSAKINKEGSGAFTDVYIDANNMPDAERLLKLQYPGYKVHFLKEVSAEGSSSSGSSSTGCALVLAPFIGLAMYGLWHVT